MAPRAREPERTCIVTRRSEPVERLIRFVAAPDGTVVADLRRRLPGRGVWVTADAEHVRIAERKRLFQRGLGAGIRVEPGLAERVAGSLRQAAVSALSFARKAGTVVTGFAKVEAALGKGTVIALVHGAEAGTDGIAKIAGAERRYRGDRKDPLPVIRLFAGEELDLAFGRTNVIHAALLAGPASINVLKRVRAFADFVGGDTGVGEPGNGLVEQDKVSAGL
ncbi:MAG: RNA-binding protein [Bauldia sp.]|uniref:RNA-binding protein n=1 Tax=Bauldia sp. TaxID=2575872 RepID=UPI001DF6CEBE|nr:RNA-binding protein [Bauldia sp.]MCB1496973.1 RNA-binding protein [Bauldia sp.]